VSLGRRLLRTTTSPPARAMNDNKVVKARYKVKNWREYNKSLRARGSITLWLSEEAQDGWHAFCLDKRGRPAVYSDLAIETALTIKAVFGLPLRGTQGFVDSLFRLLGTPLKCPDYSTLSRRGGKLAVQISPRKTAEPLVIAIDSTGLKVYGEGEWKVRKHGAGKRRTWRKLHLAVDVKTNDIVASILTENDLADCEVLPELLAQIDQPIAAVSADGAYDTKDCHEAITAKNATPKVPPREGAVVQCPQIITAKYNPALAHRDAAIRRIHALGGGEEARKTWKTEVGYHQRSLSETAMFRRKTLFSPKLSARKFQNQQQESALIINAINTMTRLGMPDSIKVAA
jgi:Transposase DDE domain